MSPKRRSSWCRYPALLALGLTLSTGCHRAPDGPKLTRVTGVVTFNGHPLPQAKVLFEPASEVGGPSWGMTDTDGKFEAYYTPRQPGAIPGKHRVQFNQVAMEKSTGGTQFIIPKKYLIGSPGIEVEVGEEPREFQFDLTKK